MRKLLLTSLLLWLLVGSLDLRAQKMRRGTLTESEVEQVRESAIFPDERIALYTKFIEVRAAKIKSLSGRPRSADRVLQLDDLLQDFTALMDEVGGNLDQYSDRHSDIRKSLKTLTETAPKWVQILRALPGEAGFDLSRKEGIESGEELSDQAKRLLSEQEEYFKTHIDDKGQERDDDKKPNT
jgi:hypothetical protein